MGSGEQPLEQHKVAIMRLLGPTFQVVTGSNSQVPGGVPFLGLPI